MIGPHARGMVELSRYMSGYYLAIGFVAGVVVGAAAVVWLFVFW